MSSQITATKLPISEKELEEAFKIIQTLLDTKRIKRINYRKEQNCKHITITIEFQIRERLQYNSDIIYVDKIKIHLTNILSTFVIRNSIEIYFGLFNLVDNLKLISYGYKKPFGSLLIKLYELLNRLY